MADLEATADGQVGAYQLFIVAPPGSADLIGGGGSGVDPQLKLMPPPGLQKRLPLLGLHVSALLHMHAPLAQSAAGLTFSCWEQSREPCIEALECESKYKTGRCQHCQRPVLCSCFCL